MISRDRLPIRYQSEPFLLFGQLSPAGQAYYIPAFLFMCESEEGRVGDLARKLAEELAGDSPSSIELRSKLTSTQKKCIGTFFEDLFRGNQDSVSLLMQIRVRLNTGKAN